MDELGDLLGLLGAGAGSLFSSLVKESVFMCPNLRTKRRALADSGSSSHSSGASGEDLLPHTEFDSGWGTYFSAGEVDMLVPDCYWRLDIVGLSASLLDVAGRSALGGGRPVSLRYLFRGVKLLKYASETLLQCCYLPSFLLF